MTHAKYFIYFSLLNTYNCILYESVSLLILGLILQISNNISTLVMTEPQPLSQSIQPQLTTINIEATTSTKLKLYIYGSCESDQYYHPNNNTESKRPICLSDIENLKLEDEEGEQGKQIIQNPLFCQSIYKVSCGALHTVVLSTEGKVYTFGCNDEGALGREGVEKVPILVPLQEPIDLISAGDNHSVFANGVIGCIYFAGNYKFLRGQKMSEPNRAPVKCSIGDIDARIKNHKIQKVASGSNHSVFLAAGRVYVKGEPEAHTVGRRINERHKIKNSLTYDGVGLNNVENVWCGGYHTIAKVKKGSNYEYFGWGLNKQGQLGLGTYDEKPFPAQIKKLRGKQIKEVAAGTNYSIFLSEEGQLYGCGQNDQSQLGLGPDYQFVDSEAEEQNNLVSQINQKMKIADSQPLPPSPQEKPDIAEEAKKEQQPAALNEVEMKEQTPVKRLKEQDIYITRIKSIPLEDKIDHITAGSESVFAWNNQNLYTWGFGMNYVLLNGQQDNEDVPFKVKSRILNQEQIYEVAAGAQHVAYLAYPKRNQSYRVQLSQNAKRLSMQAKTKLSRRKREKESKN